jgi:hypothetical protein
MQGFWLFTIVFKLDLVDSSLFDLYLTLIIKFMHNFSNFLIHNELLIFDSQETNWENYFPHLNIIIDFVFLKWDMDFSIRVSTLKLY